MCKHNNIKSNCLYEPQQRKDVKELIFVTEDNQTHNLFTFFNLIKSKTFSQKKPWKIDRFFFLFRNKKKFHGKKFIDTKY